MPSVDLKKDLELLIQFEPHTLLDRLLVSEAQYLANMFTGGNPNAIARRLIKLRGRTKYTNDSLSAPGELEQTLTLSTRIATFADAAERDILPPGAQTPLRPRGPRSPQDFRSPITGRIFTLAAAPNTRKRTRVEFELPEIIDLVTPTSTRVSSPELGQDQVLESIEFDLPEIIDLTTPTTTATTPRSSPEPPLEIIDLVTPTTTASSPGGRDFRTTSTYDRP